MSVNAFLNSKYYVAVPHINSFISFMTKLQKVKTKQHASIKHVIIYYLMCNKKICETSPLPWKTQYTLDNPGVTTRV